MEASLHSVGELAELLERKYGAQLTPAPDYILYNGRQQLLNLYYPQEIERITEQTGFTPDSPEEDWRELNRILREIALYQGCPEQDRQQNTDRWQRFLSAQEYWDSVC